MPRKSKEKPLKLARLKCKESVVIYGRNEDGKPDNCFEIGKEYLFCYDEMKDEIFTHNDVNMVHFLTLNDAYTQKHFELLALKEAEGFALDEFSLGRMKRLYKERHDFSD